jgi:hypothetical protein
MSAGPVPHQITLIAWHRETDGSLCIYDFCETSFHFASDLVRRFYRNPEICAISAIRPGAGGGGTRREIRR